MVLLILVVSGIQRASRGDLKSVTTRERGSVCFCSGNQLHMHASHFDKMSTESRRLFLESTFVLLMSIMLIGMQTQSMDGQDLPWASVGPSG